MIVEACGGAEQAKALVERHRAWAQNYIWTTQELMAANMADTGQEISLPQIMPARRRRAG
jgi:hypothetical protein